MESNKPLRTHPKMTKVLLSQIDMLDKTGHSVEDIAATLSITPEAAQRGIDKLIDRKRTEIRNTPGGAFTVSAKKNAVRAVCTEQSCPWRCNGKYYCVWPTCMKQAVNLSKTVPMRVNTENSNAMSETEPKTEADTQAHNA